MSSTFNNLFNDIKKYSLFLQENIDLYYVSYQNSQDHINSMREQISDLYPILKDNRSDTDSKTPLKWSEFIVSRWLYKQVMNQRFNLKELAVKKNQDSSIEFPQGYKVSLSHKKGDVLLGVSSYYPGIGVDIERAVKFHLAEKILTQSDYSFFNTDLIEKELLLGIIFSFKESIFKTLYPIVKRMLYFKDASITKIDMDTFGICANVRLDSSDLNEQRVYGRFYLIENNSYTNIITVAWIENQN